MTVRQTGLFIPFSLAFVKDVWRGLVFTIGEILFVRPYRPRSAYISNPGPIAPWYMFWAIARRAGLRPIRLTKTGQSYPETKIKLAIRFQDQTQLPHIAPPNIAKCLNYHCLDISKSRVAAAFSDAFGYGLAVDPETYSGPIVVKSEINGIHDGHIIQGPCSAKSGYSYQKLIDNRTQNGTVMDIRCVTLNGKVITIFLKERPVAKRFDNINSRCRLVTQISDYLSPEELRNISRFCQHIKLDYGGLDILRHNHDQRIYIVDANKTDMGPPLALPLRDKRYAIRLMAQALRRHIDQDQTGFDK